MALSPSPLSLIKPAFTPTPPPPPMSAPPPPPPVFPQGKPNPVGHLNANAPLNPALAREALLEAIRSGSGAEKLRKVMNNQAICCAADEVILALLQFSK